MTQKDRNVIWKIINVNLKGYSSDIYFIIFCVCTFRQNYKVLKQYFKFWNAQVFLVIIWNDNAYDSVNFSSVSGKTFYR